MTWQAPTPGQATVVGHVNQFLVGHPSTLVYAGAAAVTDPTLGGSADQLGSGQLAQVFQVASTTTLSYIRLALGAIGAGADVLVSIQAQSGGGSFPSGTPLAAAVVPAEWLASGIQAAASLFSIPLSASLTALTNYYIVLQPASGLLGNGAYSQAAATFNDAELTRSTAGSGALTYNPSTTTWTAQAYGYGVYLRAGTSGSLVLFSDDPLATTETPPGGSPTAVTLPTKISSYGYTGNLITGAYEWAAHSFGTIFNLLCRDDASLEVGIGSWGGAVGCTLARVAGGLDGANSLRMTVTGTPSSCSGTTSNKYAVSASTTYTMGAYVLAGTTTRNIKATINWYTSGGALISSSTGTVVAEVANSWTQCVVTAASPSNAASATLTVTVQAAAGNLATSELHYVDQIGLAQGISAVWSYPGVGVASKRTLAYTGTILNSIS